MLIHSAASAETWWLIIAGREGGKWDDVLSLVLEKVPMQTEEQCKTDGDAIFNSKDLEVPNNIHNGKAISHIRYMCILGN